MACTELSAPSTITSSGPGVKVWAGPSRLGESRARERSRLRYSSGRYCSAIDRPLTASTAALTTMIDMCLRAIAASLNRQTAIDDYLGSVAANSSGFKRNGYPDERVPPFTQSQRARALSYARATPGFSRSEACDIGSGRWVE